MVKSLKLGSKILAVILALATFICVLPMNVFAKEANKYTAIENRLETETDSTEQVAITSEIVSERDQYTKVYLRNDGTKTAIIILFYKYKGQ